MFTKKDLSVRNGYVSFNYREGKYVTLGLWWNKYDGHMAFQYGLGLPEITTKDEKELFAHIIKHINEVGILLPVSMY